MNILCKMGLHKWFGILDFNVGIYQECIRCHKRESLSA